jgi:hypothetical protein
MAAEIALSLYNSMSIIVKLPATNYYEMMVGYITALAKVE